MENNELTLQAKDLNQQGVVLLKVGKVEEAKEKFEKAIEIDPMVVDSYKNYGDLYMFTKDFKKAKDSYKKALLVEKKPILYFLIGNACFMADEIEEGLNFYNTAVAAGYDNDKMLFFLATAYEQKKDYEMSLRYYQKACIKNPINNDYKIKTIKLLLKMRSFESADKFINNLLTTSPESLEGYHFKISLLVLTDRFNEARNFAKESFAKFPNDVILLEDYIKCCVLLSDFDKASELLNIAKCSVNFKNRKASFLLMEAKLLAEKEDFDAAILILKEAIELDDSRIKEDAQFTLMNFYIVKGDFIGVFDAANSIVTNSNNTNEPNSTVLNAALYYRAFACKNLENDEEAQKYYKEAISIYRIQTLKTPSAIDAYLFRAMCLKDIGEFDKALDLVNLSVNLIGSTAEIHLLRSQIYNELGKKNLAKEDEEKAYALKPELNTTNQGG